MTHQFTTMVKQTSDVKYLRACCEVRYWEDGTVNGVRDVDGSLIPLREGTPEDNDDHGGGRWCPIIDLDNGRIEGWPLGAVANIHYKVCDQGTYDLLDEERAVVKSIDGYVPKMMSPGGPGCGDYVIMNIGPDGTIENWRVDLGAFEDRDAPQ